MIDIGLHEGLKRVFRFLQSTFGLRELLRDEVLGFDDLPVLLFQAPLREYIGQSPPLVMLLASSRVAASALIWTMFVLPTCSAAWQRASQCR